MKSAATAAEQQTLACWSGWGAIADVFDALTSRRPYKEPFSLEDSMRILEEGRGSHFEPALLDNFLTVFVVAAFGALIVDRDQVRERMHIALLEGRIAETPWGPRLGVRWWRFGAGVLLGCAFACPVKHRLPVGVAGVFAALVLIVAWATAMTPDREFAATYLSVFVIFMVGTGLSRAGRACSRR